MFDDISLKILKILQEKARIPNVEVARQVEMAPSAVLERIKKLENQGFIDGYEVRLNPKKFGKSLVAFISIKTEGNTDETELIDTLKSLPEIQEIHYVAGDDGYLIKIRASDPVQLGSLVREKILSLKAVKSTRTTIVMSTFKETAQIPIDETDLTA